MTQWPKLFHNLRSSRQTELAETFPAHVVCKWLGNTEAVAKAHYLQVTDEHFQQAIAGAALNAVQHTSETIRDDKKVEFAEVQNRPENPSDSQKTQNDPWPLSELNRYALTGIGF